ncbi:MAG: hypothetical protein PWP52_364 [Bacteroidales bacterium]|nr:hypothetical protein [Bacteroidales bacterium]
MLENYLNEATSDHPALIIYLLDISGSMAKKMPGTGKTRIEAVLDGLEATFQEMAARSSKQKIMRPRYEIAMFAYSDDVYDVYEGIQRIDIITERGIPELTLQKRTNMAFGFECVRNLLNKEIRSWTAEEKLRRPAPLVVHMTDAEISERYDNPVPIVKEIKNIEVPDGNVLVENIFITDSIKMPTSELAAFTGFRHGELLNNPFGEMLLSMSSVLPEPFRKTINKSIGLSLQKGIAMMFPGITPDFVRVGFVINGESGSARSPKKESEIWELEDD